MKLYLTTLGRLCPNYTAKTTSRTRSYTRSFFTPDSNWTWFVTEGEPDDEDFRFFGFVCGQEEEWGYFVLSELESARGPLKLHIERDLHFKAGPSSEVIALYRAARGR